MNDETDPTEADSDERAAEEAKNQGAHRAALEGAEPAGEGEEDDAAYWFDPAELVPWEDNPRLTTDEHVAMIVRSIKSVAGFDPDKDVDNPADLERGFGAPVVARMANYEIIAGHSRVAAALALKMPRVPVRFMDVDETAAHRLARADNRLTELGAWDFDALVRQLEIDARESPAIIEVQGWTEKALAELKALSAPIPAPGEGDASEESVDYAIIVNCNSELHQQQLLANMEMEGLSCRPLGGRK